MQLLAHLRLAARALRRHPGFAAVVILTLALGIGASTAVFSVFVSVLLDPLGYRAPDRLVRVDLLMPDHPDRDKRQREFLSVPFVYALRTRTEVFAGLAAMNTYRDLSADLTGGPRPLRIRELPVALDFFNVLGVSPALGRAFGPDEPDLRVAVLSHGLWDRVFGGDPAIVGTGIALDGVQHLVLGVMPAGFRHPLGHETDVWTPENLGPTPASRDDWGNHYLEVVGRLRDGLTAAQAQRRLDAFTRALSQRMGFQVEMDVKLTPLQDATVGEARPTLWVLMGAVALLLLSAGVNVANLFLVRGVGRQRELAVRTALGAGRRGLLGHLLGESLLLAMAGGAAGVGIAFVCVRILTALRPEGLPRIGEITVDGSVLAFASAVTITAGLAFGAVPAVQFLRGTPGRALRDSGARAGAGRRQRRLQSALVVAQVAGALVLLVGAGILVKSLLRLQRVELGFESSAASTYMVNLPSARYRTPEHRIAFHRELQQRVGALPQVRASGAVDWLPVRGRYHPWGFVRLDLAEPRGEIGDARVVSGDYFEAVGIPLVRGRRFASTDGADAPKVAVVSRSVVAGTYGGADPLGRRIRLLGREWEVVGVVGDVAVNPYGAVVPLVYLPHDQFADNRNWALFQVVAWHGDAADGMARIRAAVAAIDPALVVYQAQPLRAVVAAALGRQRFTLLVMGCFAGSALLLAGVGLYGVIAYVVREQTQEISVRLALGARRVDIMGLVLGRASRMVAIGVGVGLAAALAVGGWLESLTFEVTTTDPAVLTTVVMGLLAVAWVAAYLPARRAAGLNPARAFRDA